MTLIQMILAFNPNFATDHPRLFTFIVNHPGVALDRDGDGYTTAVDCDDREATVHPGQQEICDGWDNDCDGLVNEDDPDVIGGYWFYLDLDQDGYGVSDEQFDVYQCPAIPPTPAYVRFTATGEEDCDDSDASINPSADELVDGIDQDCDGETTCELPVELEGGAIAFMENAVLAVLSSQSPSGITSPGFHQEALVVNLSTRSDCAYVEIEGATIQVNTTDNAFTGWDEEVLVEIVDIDDPTTIIYSDMVPTNAPVELEFAALLQPGETMTLSFRVDSTGASTSLDDAIRVDLLSLNWNDETQSISGDVSHSVNGNTLQF